jgi:hypothetical protein
MLLRRKGQGWSITEVTQSGTEVNGGGREVGGGAGGETSGYGGTLSVGVGVKLTWMMSE